MGSRGEIPLFFEVAFFFFFLRNLRGVLWVRSGHTAAAAAAVEPAKETLVLDCCLDNYELCLTVFFSAFFLFRGRRTIAR